MYEHEADAYRTLGDSTRLRILALLRVREACVCELVARVPVSQPAVSQHLRRLRQAGFLTERRQKQWMYYAIRDDLPPLLAQIVASLPRDAEDEEWLRGNQVDTICAAVPEPMDHATVRLETGKGVSADGR